MKPVDWIQRQTLPIKCLFGYSVLWTLCLLDLRSTQLIPDWLGMGVFGCCVPVLGFWAFDTVARGEATNRRRWLVASIAFLFLWQFLLVLLDWFGFAVARAGVARWGSVALFAIGLLWVVWYVDRWSPKFSARPIDGDQDPWHPLDLRSWYYGIDWWKTKLRRFLRFTFAPRDTSDWPHGPRSRKLDQSLLTLISYTFSFLIIGLLLAQLNGCREIYEMPAGGGEQKQLAQVVKIKKVIRKKYVINPLSSISFEVPPIDEVQLKLMEITEHAYTVGYGEGKGAGFAGGTFRGKVRFIRLEYSGGDWDQDFGIGGDMNMLIEYGIRTQHKVGERTESRRISQLDNFPLGKSPPVVYMTGQQNISVSNSEVKTLREYLGPKHGMLFCDNGGSRHFHNQFLALMNRILPDVRPVPIPLDDIIHRVPYQIPFLPYVAPHGGKEALGWYKDGRWVAYYHPGDIGDAWADGHAGVKADIWESCYQIGTNVLFYAHSEYAKWLEARKQE